MAKCERKANYEAEKARGHKGNVQKVQPLDAELGIPTNTTGKTQIKEENGWWCEQS